jgi:hypothetical protein
LKTNTKGVALFGTRMKRGGREGRRRRRRKEEEEEEEQEVEK